MSWLIANAGWLTCVHRGNHVLCTLTNEATIEIATVLCLVFVTFLLLIVHMVRCVRWKQGDGYGPVQKLKEGVEDDL